MSLDVIETLTPPEESISRPNDYRFRSLEGDITGDIKAVAFSPTKEAIEYFSKFLGEGEDGVWNGNNDTIVIFNPGGSAGNFGVNTVGTNQELIFIRKDDYTKGQLSEALEEFTRKFNMFVPGSSPGDPEYDSIQDALNDANKQNY